MLRKQTEFYYICLFIRTDTTFAITQTILNHCICLNNTLCAVLIALLGLSNRTDKVVVKVPFFIFLSLEQ